MAGGIECFGNPPGLQGLGGELTRTGTGLDQVCADAKQEVARLQPNWQSPSSDDFRRLLTNQMAAVLREAGKARRFSDTVFTLAKGLATAMQQFELAEQAAAAYHVVIIPATFTVVATTPDSEAAVPLVRAMVINAQQIAEEARIQASVSLDGIEESDSGLGDLLSIFVGPRRPSTKAPLPLPRTNVPKPPPPPPAGHNSKATADWKKLEEQARQPVARKKDNGFSSWTARDGVHQVTIVEGKVTDQIAPADSNAKYGARLPGEHATHAVGAQLGENLPEGLASAPASELNLGPLKKMENAIRGVYDRANELHDAELGQGASVETSTTFRIEHRLVPDSRGVLEDVPVLVGVKREAWIRPLGTDDFHTFATFEASVDPVTREVTILQSSVTGAAK
jgi:hypothetical protein